MLCNKSGSLKVVTHNSHTVPNNYSTEDCIKHIQSLNFIVLVELCYFALDV